MKNKGFLLRAVAVCILICGLIAAIIIRLNLMPSSTLTNIF